MPKVTPYPPFRVGFTVVGSSSPTIEVDGEMGVNVSDNV
jgi:hypothetical protein